jgi:peptide-methionine (S)-S-oxide reductase
MAQEIALLGGGCFWCLEAVYDQLNGVISVESGYAGGHVDNPTYEQICGKMTGHAEVVQVTFDPAVITYQDVLDIFFTIHDPTTLNRQGNDVGPQYRSVIFYHSAEQQAVALNTIGQINADKLWPNPLVTEVQAAPTFYIAEDYHQEYFARNPFQGYCMGVVAPKVAKFRKQHFNRLKKA